MKKKGLHLVVLACTLLASCSTDVDLYADYKQVPIVYGLLDARADTNYIKITRSYYVEGDPYEMALNPDSSNYPGKLDVRLIEYCNGDSLRELILDTITIHDKTQGIFYAPLQKLYYTSERLPLNNGNKKYSYLLKVVLPDNDITAKADLVGNGGFDVQSLGVNFSKTFFGAASRRFLFHPATNAAYYDVWFAFNFKEQHGPEGDSVPRTMQWHIGTYSDFDLSQHMEENCYAFYYRPEAFWEVLDRFIGDDTVAGNGLRRYFGDYPVDVIIEAGGNKLYQYVHTSDAMIGNFQDNNDFSLINGGFGVFSSRFTVRHAVGLAGETVPDLLAERRWGFKFIGGK